MSSVPYTPSLSHEAEFLGLSNGLGRKISINKVISILTAGSLAHTLQNNVQIRYTVLIDWLVVPVNNFGLLTLPYFSWTS